MREYYGKGRKGILGTSRPRFARRKSVHGNCPASESGTILAEHLEKFRFANDLDSERLRLVQLGPGLLSGDDKICLLAHAAADFSSRGFDFRGGLFAL